MLLLLYGKGLYTTITFDVFLKWRTPFVNLYPSTFPVRSSENNADIKMTINLICNYHLLFTMSKTNKTITGRNIFYVNILHNFMVCKTFFSVIIWSILFFTLINMPNSQLKSYSRVGRDIFWPGVQWPFQNILQWCCSSCIPILYSHACHLISVLYHLFSCYKNFRSILGWNLNFYSYITDLRLQ